MNGPPQTGLGSVITVGHGSWLDRVAGVATAQNRYRATSSEAPYTAEGPPQKDPRRCHGQEVKVKTTWMRLLAP